MTNILTDMRRDPASRLSQIPDIVEYYLRPMLDRASLLIIQSAEAEARLWISAVNQNENNCPTRDFRDVRRDMVADIGSWLIKIDADRRIFDCVCSGHEYMSVLPTLRDYCAIAATLEPRAFRLGTTPRAVRMS